MRKLRRWLWKLNQVVGCPKCGCKETSETTMDFINGMACEILISCKRCNIQVNYWAYGGYQEPTTKTELIGWYWYHFKSWLNRKTKFKWKDDLF